MPYPQPPERPSSDTEPEREARSRPPARVTPRARTGSPSRRRILCAPLQPGGGEAPERPRNSRKERTSGSAPERGPPQRAARQSLLGRPGLGPAELRGPGGATGTRAARPAARARHPKIKAPGEAPPLQNGRRTEATRAKKINPRKAGEGTKRASSPAPRGTAGASGAADSKG